MLRTLKILYTSCHGSLSISVVLGFFQPFQNIIHFGYRSPFSPHVHNKASCPLPISPSPSFLSPFLTYSSPSVWLVFPHPQDSRSQCLYRSPIQALGVPLSIPLASFEGGDVLLLPQTLRRSVPFPQRQPYWTLLLSSHIWPSLASCCVSVATTSQFSVLVSSGALSLLGQVLPSSISVHLLPLQ